MTIKDFDFQLPKELIAQTPASPRDSARLLVYDRSTQTIVDDVFYNLADHLNPKTTLVLNKAKVDKCRLIFGKVEIFVLETYNDKSIKAMVRPGKKFKKGDRLQLTNDISATVDEIDENGHRYLSFGLPLDDQRFKPHMLTPLPPYIAQDETLAGEYQTVYAKDSGSKAAPTAGLHFTPQLLSSIAESWPIVEVTLNVSLGTFAPIGETEIQAKKLHEESYSISKTAAVQLNQACHITAVGTTSIRTLESAYASGFKPVNLATTDAFIQPGDQLQVVNDVITNFHLPSTSLLMLIATFTGRDELMHIYHHAIKQKYRFYSFGDAMLIK